jgi:outer membrane protein assembly factor BamA
MSLCTCSLLLWGAGAPCNFARPQETAKAKVSKLRLAGLRTLPQDQILLESGLKPGDLAGREDLQAAADRLARLGIFSKITFEYRTQADGITVNFQVEEAPRVPVFFDNVPWFTDAELTEAIRKTIPFYEGTAPEGGSVLDRIAEAVRRFLESHQLRVAVEHELIANPLGDGTVQEFRISGASLRIARIDFSDPLAASSRALQVYISELLGKPYSRLTIELFLSEQVKPVYLQKGYVRVKLGPPEIRLTENPARPLPEMLPVYVPVAPGAVYHWQGAQWSGNSSLTTAQLNDSFALKSGEVANGQAIEAAFERVREEYGRRGYLEAQVDPQPSYEDQAHTLSYRVSVTEGLQYRYGDLVLTGASLAAEKLIRASWPIPRGEIFDKLKFEAFLARLQEHGGEVFGELAVHYTEIGHWLRTDPQKKTVDVLLDFK